MTAAIIRISPVRVALIIAALVFLPKAHFPHTVRGKVMCNGILASEVAFHVDGTATLQVPNGAQVHLLVPDCAVLEREPHVGMGPEIEE